MVLQGQTATLMVPHTKKLSQRGPGNSNVHEAIIRVRLRLVRPTWVDPTAAQGLKLVCMGPL